MENICKLAGKTPENCANCDLYLELCWPVIGPTGFIEGAECDLFYCDQCGIDCAYNN